MSGTFFMMMAANGGVQEQPVDGQTGVWIKEAGITISSAMKMTGATVGSGQSQYIYNRGLASSCTISAGGTQYISSGGTARDCAVVRFQYVMPGGAALGTILAGSGAPRQFMSSGAWASGTVLDYIGAAMQVGAGASAADITLRRGTLWLTGSAGGITISSNAVTSVYAGGIGSAFTLASGANLVVASGASALAVTSNAGANVTVESGGYIEYA